MAAVAVVLFGISLTVIAALTVGANSLSIDGEGMDIVQLHRDAGTLPTQKFHDMALVFPGDA
jgi:hypothetical protein